jgi:hypothetical protein
MHDTRMDAQVLIASRLCGYAFRKGANAVLSLQSYLAAHLQRLVDTVVVGLRKDGDMFSVETEDTTWSSRAVIIATGAQPQRLDLASEWRAGRPFRVVISLWASSLVSGLALCCSTLGPSTTAAALKEMCRALFPQRLQLAGHLFACAAIDPAALPFELNCAIKGSIVGFSDGTLATAVQSQHFVAISPAQAQPMKALLSIVPA